MKFINRILVLLLIALIGCNAQKSVINTDKENTQKSSINTNKENKDQTIDELYQYMFAWANEHKKII